MTTFVRSRDGRTLAVEERGAPDGRPIFLLHGTPGSRLGPSPRAAVLWRLSVRLITYDRPGYGYSDRLFGRRVADAVNDISDVADALGISNFAVVGRSGGAPHALACGALLPDRTTRVAALVPLAPPGAEGLDWFEGMTSSNVTEFKAATRGHGAALELLAPAVAEIQADPMRMIPAIDDLPEVDQHVVSNYGIRRMLVRNVAEALRSSPDGWVDDNLAFRSPWGFEPETISVPTLLWHGEEDVFSPLDHARWLSERIPDANLVVEAGVGHFGSLEVLPSVLTWLA
ncbi:alpha/beta hydrolase [Streptosporangiaceae bacterium NEAU-GS5]|nr:alpha/beta hydrolase [Streptosporangiaceae bacterium NEAU-GS5]